jgi:UDP-glucose:glycoprotein glucosyltransferase
MHSSEGTDIYRRETLALDDPSAFFPALDALTSPGALARLSSSPSTEAAFHFLLAAAQEAHLLRADDDDGPSTLEAALALHVAAPAINAHYAFYRDAHGARLDLAGRDDCESWVDWYGTFVCDLGTLERLVGHEEIDAPSASPTFVRPLRCPYYVRYLTRNLV